MELPSIPKNIENLPDRDIGEFIYGWWIACNAARRGISADQVTPELIKSLCAATWQMDTDDAKDILAEKVIRFAVAGEYERSGKLYRSGTGALGMFHAAIDEATTGTRRQRANAQQPRPSTLTILIDEIVAINPDITETELLEKLRTHEYVGVIEEITDDEIYFIGEDGEGGKSAKISGLKDRLSRARKKISSL